MAGAAFAPIEGVGDCSLGSVCSMLVELGPIDSTSPPRTFIRVYVTQLTQSVAPVSPRHIAIHCIQPGPEITEQTETHPPTLVAQPIHTYQGHA